MAHVFQTKDKSGKPHRKWRFQYTDWTGRRRTATGTTSRAETERIAFRIEDEHHQIRQGYKPPRDTAGKHRRRPFADVQDEYVAWGSSQGGRRGHPWGRGHVRMRRAHLAWWQEQLGLETLADLEGTLPRAERALRELASAGRSGKTLQNYCEALHALCAWCVERGYLLDNPLARLASFDTSPKSRRRAMTGGEIRRLLDSCAPKRRTAYEVALLTGLRAEELRHLTAADLDVKRGGLQLNAAWTKNRRPGFQPLPQAFLARLAQHARDKAPGDALLFVPSHAARDLDKDLSKANIPKWTPDGKLDFHALRTTFGTLAVESGANVKETQELERHSTPVLTMNRYVRTRPGRLEEVLEGIGRVVFGDGESRSSAQRKTTDAEEFDISDALPTTYETERMVEAAGIEPASQEPSTEASTHIVSLLCSRRTGSE